MQRKGFALIGLILALIAVAALGMFLIRSKTGGKSDLQQQMEEAGLESPDNVDNPAEAHRYIEDKVRATTNIEEQRLKCQVDQGEDCSK